MKKKAYLMVLALCAALAITACGTSTDQKDDKKPAAEAQDTTDKEDSGSAKSQKKRIPIKTAKRQPPEIQGLFPWMM